MTPGQRELLRQIANLATNTINAEATKLRNDFYAGIGAKPRELNQVNDGSESLAAFGVPIPRSYQLYLDLGRFRNALVLEEQKRHPTPGLEHFISLYRLEGYKPVEVSAAHPAGSH